MSEGYFFLVVFLVFGDFVAVVFFAVFFAVAISFGSSNSGVRKKQLPSSEHPARGKRHRGCPKKFNIVDFLSATRDIEPVFA